MWLVLPQADKQPSYYDPYYMSSTNENDYSGTVYSTTGPSFDSANFATAPAVVVTAVGTATISFLSADQGTFSYTVNGLKGTAVATRSGTTNTWTASFIPGAAAKYSITATATDAAGNQKIGAPFTVTVN